MRIMQEETRCKMNATERLKEIEKELKIKIEVPFDIDTAVHCLKIEAEKKGILLGLESHGECVHRDEAAKTCHEAFQAGKKESLEFARKIIDDLIDQC